MIHCIVGAIMACHNYAGIYVDGPLGYARSAPASPAYSYALYAVPLQQPAFPAAFPVRRG
jgi:hypothetical protein